MCRIADNPRTHDAREDLGDSGQDTCQGLGPMTEARAGRLMNCNFSINQCMTAAGCRTEEGEEDPRGSWDLTDRAGGFGRPILLIILHLRRANGARLLSRSHEPNLGWSRPIAKGERRRLGFKLIYAYLFSKRIDFANRPILEP